MTVNMLLFMLAVTLATAYSAAIDDEKPKETFGVGDSFAAAPVGETSLSQENHEQPLEVPQGEPADLETANTLWGGYGGYGGYGGNYYRPYYSNWRNGWGYGNGWGGRGYYGGWGNGWRRGGWGGWYW